MFSFRSDKTGFIVALVLGTIVLGTVISTLVLLLIGIGEGDWKSHLLSVKWILAGAWVTSIVTVLVRIGVFSYQKEGRLAALRQERAAGAKAGPGETNNSAGEPSSDTSPQGAPHEPEHRQPG
jgi:hypothetical protein